MGKNILYIANYYLDDVIEQRNSAPYISQAGQNKSTYMIEMFRTGGNEVTVWSNAWTKSTSGKFYRGFQSKMDPQVYYADILGFPFLNVWACKRSCKKFLRTRCKTKKFDAIVFYNMRLENAPVALWAKKKFNIPIFLQYEDGLTKDAHVNGLKRYLYSRMEKRTLPELDGAFLVTSMLKVPCPSLVVRGAIRNRICKSTMQHEKPILLFSSTLDRQRGIEVLLEALQFTKEDFSLVISGRGELEECATACKDQRVDYKGYVRYEEYQKLLEQADICINAQLAHAEFGNVSFPSKIYEYLSYGKLVVSSDVADAKSAIGDFCFIYEMDDPRKLAGCIDQAICVWKDKEKYSKYQRRIEHFLEENAMDKIAQKANLLLEGKNRKS